MSSKRRYLRNCRNRRLTIEEVARNKFKLNIEELATLGQKGDKKTDSFLIFQKELHDYVLSNYKYPKDIVYLVTEMKDLMKKLIKDMLSLKKLKKGWSIDPSPPTTLTAEEI